MLDRIISPVSLQITYFEERFQNALNSEVDLVQTMGSHVLKSHGKGFRPILALLTAEAIGDCSDQIIDAAVGIEIIHIATLIHDDVIDSADTRRGTEALNLLYGNHASILMGDFLLAKALEILVGLGSLDVMKAATRATRCMIEGEILESQSGDSAEAATYFNMIDKKTASLMALACEIGAILGGGTSEQIDKMSNFGKKVGMAFQITDDLLDFVGDEKALGKPVGNDLRERKLTLPLIRALANCENGDAQKIQTKILAGLETEEECQEIIHFVHRYHGINEARNEAQIFAQSALKNLGILSGSPAREALTLVGHYAVDRER